MHINYDSIIKNLTSTPTELSHLVRIDGPDTSKTLLKDVLTIENSSVAYQIFRAKKSLGFWYNIAESDKKTYGFIMPKTGTRINEAIKTIEELEPQKVVNYYTESEGELFIPSGLWFLTSARDGDYHLNTEIPFNPGKISDMRGYQTELCRELLKYKRATGVLATGLGKSRCIAAIALSAAAVGKRTFIVVPTDYLVGQITDTIKDYYDSVTGAGGKRSPKLGCDIFVCTAASAKKYIAPYDVVIIDECQHSPATTWVELMTIADRATHVYNFTATAFRADGLDMGIHAFGGPVVYERDARWGIANGWLAPLDVYFKKFEFRTPVVRADAMATSAYSRMVGSVVVLSWLCEQIKFVQSKGKKVIVLFKTVKMARKFKKICKDHLDFQIADAKFKKPLDDFRYGKITLLVACDRLVAEGIDIPDADCLFLLTQNSSDVITYQSVGRVLRKSAGKPKAIVIDVAVTNKEFEQSKDDLGLQEMVEKPKMFRQFNNALDKRTKVYKSITDNMQTMPTVVI